MQQKHLLLVDRVGKAVLQKTVDVLSMVVVEEVGVVQFQHLS
jgi:hypothetical protein